MRPASFRIDVYLSGEPADVVTNSMPSSTIIWTMSASFTNASGRLTPNGLSVSSRVRRMSSAHLTVPAEPGTRPIAPAFDTAAMRGGFAMKPIGACTIGISTPSRPVTRFEKRMRRT